MRALKPDKTEISSKPVRRYQKILFAIIILFAMVLFIYTPFYSQAILWLLNRFVPIDVNNVAAQSQLPARLSLENEFEPGSKSWIARQAYLYEMMNVEQKDTQKFKALQQKYQQLLAQIEIEKQTEKAFVKTNPKATTPLTAEVLAEDEVQPISQAINSLQPSNSTSDKEKYSLFQRYRVFLTGQVVQAESNTQPNKGTPTPIWISQVKHLSIKAGDQPHAIVVLGGGLRKQNGKIVINAYTEKRLQQTYHLYQQQPLPIVLSGVESPYMQKWLIQHDIQAEFLENKSMNTCENTRFTALLLQKQGGAPNVYLITDAYHMPRSQRLFAQNGIQTIPIVADLPNPLTQWQPALQNWMHSRRATYEMIALLRDSWVGQTDCREIP